MTNRADEADLDGFLLRQRRGRGERHRCENQLSYHYVTLPFTVRSRSAKLAVPAPCQSTGSIWAALASCTVAARSSLTNLANASTLICSGSTPRFANLCCSAGSSRAVSVASCSLSTT